MESWLKPKGSTGGVLSRAVLAVLLVLLLALSACQGAPLPVVASQVETTPSVPPPVLESTRTAPSPTLSAAETIESPPPPLVFTPQPEPQPTVQTFSAGEPAGCRTAVQQSELATAQDMLAYADSLLHLNQPLSARVLPASWNATRQQYLRAPDPVLTFSAAGLRYDPVLQKILNALHVAGFAAWLRESPEQQLHILAVPLLDPDWQQGAWAEYIRAYWQSRGSQPADDPYIIQALKLPPCRWMVAGGFAPQRDASWWAGDPLGWPDYASSSAEYLAEDSVQANQVAERIDWLGPNSKEGAATMCGPLVWSEMRDAGAFPPGVGGWSSGPKSFWLSKPSVNGRPWSLFPPESYVVYHFDRPLGVFNFANFPLYPGDFLYTYSKDDGFDHMLLVTEVDGQGNIYTVTNRVWEVPQKHFAIERVLFASTRDSKAGIAKNEWHSDRRNGRTGHAGFEVFRWAWAEKDILGEAAAYTIQVGDTLGLVAARWRTPAEQIAQYNRIELDADLIIGQELKIPPNSFP